METPMSLDHGTLNVPLAKRGNIDAQIDAYKRDQARAARNKAKDRAAELQLNRTIAKDLLAAAPIERIAKLADRCKSLASDAHFQPSLIIKLFAA
jgi:hypothetical protein